MKLFKNLILSGLIVLSVVVANSILYPVDRVLTSDQKKALVGGQTWLPTLSQAKCLPDDNCLGTNIACSSYNSTECASKFEETYVAVTQNKSCKGDENLVTGCRVSSESTVCRISRGPCAWQNGVCILPGGASQITLSAANFCQDGI